MAKQTKEKDFETASNGKPIQEKLSGWVTLADMKQGLLPAMVRGLSVADLMIKNPITIHPDADIEVAARIIHENKIGGMPVVDDDNKLVDVITVSDLLNAFINIMGILTYGTRLDVSVGEKPDGFEKVSRFIEAPRSPRSTAVRQNLRGMRSLLRFTIKEAKWLVWELPPTEPTRKSITFA